MDYEVIMNLMREMDQSSLSSFELEMNGTKLKLEKNVMGQVAVMAAPQINPISIPTSNQSVTQGVSAMMIKETEEILVQQVDCEQLTSPMVGTFYAQSSPEKPPFVKVGDHVKKGQILCIIEAMKLMNDIESECDGEIVEIYCQNEQMVEYGQPMFAIKRLEK